MRRLPAGRLRRRVVEDEPRGRRLRGVVPRGAIPDKDFGGQVEVAGPFDRSVSDAGASELGVVRPQALEDRASQKVADLALDRRPGVAEPAMAPGLVGPNSLVP
jgi:hypothetical protein